MVRTAETNRGEAGAEKVMQVSSPWYVRRLADQSSLGFNAGDTNLYRYVGNSPTNATDPSGLQPPSRPPTPTKQEIEDAEKWMRDRYPKLTPGKDYTIVGAVGTPPKNPKQNNWHCAQCVAAALDPKYDWVQKPPVGLNPPLPVGPTTFTALDTGARNIGAFFKPEKENTMFEAGQQKLVVYGKKEKDGKCFVQHYALQLPDGNWISKLGIEGPTIIHGDLMILTGYGEIIRVYSRPNPDYKK